VEEALGRLHKIADRVPGVVYQYRLKPDGTSCFPYASEGIRAIYRVSPEDVLDDASTILSKLHPDDLNGVAESIQASARELTLWRHEYRVKFDDGVVRWMSGNAFPQREADGSVLWHGFISDITKRREAEEALLESQNRFALFMDYLPVIVFIKDNEGRTIYVNNTMDAALGASKWIGLKLTDIFDSDTAARILEDDQKTMKLGDQKIEESFIHLDGTIHHYETQKFIIPGFGKSPMLGGIALDITERKQAEDELKQLSTRLTMATRAGGVGVWDFDVETNSLFWDNQMLELYGIGKENFTGAYQTWLSGVHPDDRERGDQDIQAAILGEKEFDNEFRVVWPDGSVRNIKGQAVVQRDGSGRALHLIGTNWDITPQRRKEAFEKEILRLSVQLTGIRGSDLSSAIDLALGSIGHYLSADRAFVYEFKADNIISKTHEWCNHPVGPKIEKFTDLSVDYFPFPFDLLKRHENIVIPSVRSLPESRRKEREALESYGIKSIIVMPILVDNNLVGMVGLNMEAKEREYEPFEISNLVLWSNMLAGLIRNQKNELLLEQTRKNYETFFNTIDDFLFVLNEQGEIIQTNNTVVNRLGYSTPEMVDKSVLMVHPAERRQEAGRIVGEMLAGTADYCPVPLVAKSGILIPVETRVKPGFWDGNPVIFGVSKDVSKIKLSEEKFSKAFQSNSNLMAISGLDTGDFLDINDAFLNTLGYSRDEVIGKTTVEINLFADRDFRSTVIDSLKNHQRVRDIETQVNTKSGNVLMGLFSAEMIFIGSESSLLTVMVDITDRKLAEESLRSKMALLEAQKNATPDGLLVIDENQKRILVNKRIIEIFDVPGNIAENEDDAAMLSHVVSLTRYPEKFLEKVLYLNDHREETSRDEIEMKNGMILDRYSAPVLDAEGKSYGRIWSFRDVTESKRAEQEIIKARNEADQANLAKSEFLSRMSHELRTPMNSILGFAQLMDMGELKPAHRKGVHHILNSGKHLLNLINEVLDISRIEAGRLTLSPEPVQLRTMILETVDIIHQAAVQQQQTIVFADSPVSLLFVKADRQSLKQVLLNLLNNAVKYNKERGVVTIAASVSGKDVKAPPVVRISISDEGAGISAGDMGKLFLPFERIGAEKTATEGTGLGLTVVKKLMEAMGGIVGVDSMPGKGSTFWIELPETDSQKILFDKAGLNSIPEKVNAEITGTILYVEDNHSNTELVEEIILTHRPAIRLITTMLGKKAVKLALDNQPGLILLDLDLPDIPGIEVLADLREDPQTRAIPVVIVSADATIQEIEKLKKAGALGYLTKPIDIAAFLEVVDKIEIKPMKP
ncbi:MAG: PAS domain S-box protein, partial [Bacteroidota bacterium]